MRLRPGALGGAEGKERTSLGLAHFHPLMYPQLSFPTFFLPQAMKAESVKVGNEASSGLARSETMKNTF